MTFETQTPPKDLPRKALLLAAINHQVLDPKVRLALEYSLEKIPEPPLSLGQIQEALTLIHPGGRPCARTIQRWVKERGFPYCRNQTNDRRIYFLSSCLDWYRATFPSISIAERAAQAAHASFA